MSRKRARCLYTDQELSYKRNKTILSRDIPYNILFKIGELCGSISFHKAFFKKERDIRWGLLGVFSAIRKENRPSYVCVEYVVDELTDTNKYLFYRYASINSTLKNVLELRLAQSLIFNDIEQSQLLFDSGASFYSKPLGGILIRMIQNWENQYSSNTVEFVLKHKTHSQFCLDLSLCWAARTNNVRMVNLILDAGAHVSFETNRPLREAVNVGHIHVVNTLLKYGADPNAPARLEEDIQEDCECTDSGICQHCIEETVLDVAILGEQWNIVKTLIQHNANIDVQSRIHIIFSAIQSNNIYILDWIQAKGVNIRQSIEGYKLAKRLGRKQFIEQFWKDQEAKDRRFCLCSYSTKNVEDF